MQQLLELRKFKCGSDMAKLLRRHLQVSNRMDAARSGRTVAQFT